jgi:hemerythrin
VSLFRWGAEFRVGVQDIDEQHEKFVRLINELHDAMVAGHPPAVVARVLADAHTFARLHFLFEEELMALHEYPEREGHVAEHEKFLARTGELHERYAAGDARVALEAVLYLVDWLAEHNQGNDEKLAQFLKTRGVS